MEARKELYIGGRWTAPESGGEIAVIDSRTEEVMGSVPRGGAAEVERAVAAAREAFPAWSASSVDDRVAALRAIADGLEARTDELAELMSREVGTPIVISKRVQVGLAVDVFRSIADVLADFPVEERIGTSLLSPAGRRRRGDHAVELPALPARRQARAGAGRRVHHGPQARRCRAAGRVRARRDHRRARAAAGTVSIVTGPGARSAT